MGRSKSSRRWLEEHFDDAFVKRAQKEGWRGRAAFKLLELQDRHRLIRPGMRVVDLGAAPGAFSQVVLRETGGQGTLVALDMLPMEPLDGATVLQGDFTDDAALKALRERLGEQPLDLVLSDMAPNMSGMSAMDQPRAMYLAELALEFAIEWLRPGGDSVIKAFQGEGFDEFLRRCRAAFDRVAVKKPRASRPRSREVYVLGQGRKLQ